MLEQTIEEKIIQLEREIARDKARSKAIYRKALANHYYMVANEQLHSDDDKINQWDKDILIVKRYRRKHFLAWIEQKKECEL